MNNNKISLVLKAVAFAMGVSTLTLSILDKIESNGAKSFTFDWNGMPVIT